MPVPAHHDFLHENTGETNFNESMYFNFYDRKRGWGGFARIGNRPNEGYAEVTLALYRPDGTALFQYQRPPIADNKELCAGGMRFEILEPARHLRVSYKGSAVFLQQPLDLEDPRRAFTTNPWRAVELDLDYYGLSPMYGGEAPAESTSSKLVFARGHTEQHVRAVGTLSVEGETIPIEALGLRDHSWGPRSWQSPAYYRWLTAEFDESFGFMGSWIHLHGGQDLQSGFVFRDGANELVHRVEIETKKDGRTGYHSELQVRLHTAKGSIEVSGEVICMLPLRNRRDGKVTRIAEGLTRWRAGSQVGYGWSEYLDQVA
ncbi:MAG: hypothetical protein KatS3mg077_1558 [Candidatus Binatia bacterium]|nr:MAG: hypothetical protein KatS3mg077_1558 [Candidatus Binatia bacterium]